MFSFRRKIDIVLLYEKGVRELEIATLLKYQLERNHGVTVKILQQNFEIWSAWLYKPKLVLLPYCYQNRSNNLFLSLWRKSKFINLSWEQLFYKGNKIAKTPRGVFATKYVQHHSWSNSYSDYLISVDVPKAHIFTNGNLSLKLYQEPYRRYYDDPYTAIEDIKQYNKRILLSENFNWAFYSDDMIDQMVNDGQDIADIRRMVEYNNRSFEMICRWVIQALRENPAYLLIFRPRPATSIEQVKQKLGQFGLTIPDNFLILKTGSVREWILYSDLVISTYSTTLIEAVSANKPALMLEPLPMPDSLFVEWHGYITKATTFTDMESYIHLPERIDNTRLREWIKMCFFNQADPISHLTEFIARNIMTAENNPKVPKRYLVYNQENAAIAPVLFHCRIIILSLVNLPKLFSTDRKSEYYQDYAMKAGISGMIRRWSKIF